MKRLAVIIPALIILIVAAALIGPSFIDWNQHKATIEQQVKAHTDLDLKLNGKLSLALLPFPRVSATDITVHAPEKGHYESVLSLKRVDVGLELFPLLSGTIAVQSLDLLEPKISLEMGAEGELSAITPKLEAQMNGEGQETPVAAQPSAMPAISFEHIGIKDGQFAIYDSKTKSETLVENISGTLKAGTLLGPYEADLSLLNQGRIVNLDVKTETFNPETKIVSAKIDAELQPGNIKAQYAGAFDMSKGFAAQGQMEIIIDELGKTLLANNIIATQDAVQGKFEAKGFLNADATKAEIRQFEASVADQKISGQVDITYEPMSIAANLKSENKLDLQKFLAAYPGLKTASFDLDFKGDQNSVSISKATVALNDEPYALSGDYIFKNKSDRSELNVNFSGETLDLSIFDQESNLKNNEKTNAKDDFLKSSQGVNLPIDMVFAIKLNNVSYQGQKFTKFSVKGDAVQNALKIDALSFNGYSGAQIALAGQVKDLSSVSGLSVIGSVDMKDLKATAGAFGADTAQIPAGIKAAVAKFKVAGDMSAVDGTLNFSASNGELIAQGNIASPSSAPTIQELTLQLKHRNMDEAIRLFSGSEDKNPAFSKPLDVFAKIRQSENGSYQLSGIKGDLSGMKVQGDMVLDTTQQKPSLNGDLRFENINLGGSGSSQGGASAQSSAGGKGKAQGGSRWSKDPIDLSGLNAFNADLKISADALKSGPWIISEPKMGLLVKDGTLTVQDLQGGLFGGNLALTSTVQASVQARQPSHIDAQGSLENVDIAALVKALAGSNIVKASGRVSTDIDLKTSGLSMAAFVYDLSGKGTVSGSDIILDGVDVERFAVALSEESKPGDTVMGIWKGASKGGSTTFETLDGNFGIVEGIVGIHKLDLDGPQASIFTTGKIDLPNWTVSTKHKLTAKTRPDVPPFEMAFSGSLDNPAQTFGQGVLNDYLQRKVERKVNKLLSDKLSDKIGIPFGNQPQPQAQEIPQEPNDIAPADGQPIPEEPAAEPAQQEEPQNQEELKPEDAIKDVLKGLLE